MRWKRTKLRNSNNRENPLTETKFPKFLDEAALTHAATGHDHSVRKGLYSLPARNLEPQRRLSPSIRLAVQAEAASLWADFTLGAEQMDFAQRHSPRLVPVVTPAQGWPSAGAAPLLPIPTLQPSLGKPLHV